MTKYYVVIIKDDAQAVNKYDTQAAALAALFAEMAYACNANINTTCILTTERGRVLRTECYDAIGE